jgi:hypothetical protein
VCLRGKLWKDFEALAGGKCVAVDNYYLGGNFCMYIGGSFFLYFFYGQKADIYGLLCCLLGPVPQRALAGVGSPLIRRAALD